MVLTILKQILISLKRRALYKDIGNYSNFKIVLHEIVFNVIIIYSEKSIFLLV